MTLQPFMISGYNTGLQKDRAPWKLIDDAFESLENMYLYEETARKRECPLLLGRLQITITGEVVGDKTDHYVYTLANAPIVPGTLVLTDAGHGQVIEDDSYGVLFGDGTGTIDYLTGDIDVTFAIGTGVVTATYDYYPLLPVMGIHLRETSTINVEETIIFDTRTPYIYNQVASKFASIATVNQEWSGDDSQFFSAINYFITAAGAKYFWATNGKAYSSPGAPEEDGIKYYDGTNWATLRPIIYNDGSDRYLNGAKILIAFQGALIAMNTIEDVGAAVVNFQNRIRWCGIEVDPTGANAWRHDIIGNGLYETGTQNQAIQSAAIVNGKLIVYFERSTAELEFTGNKKDPFRLKSISIEFGCDSTFSTQLANATSITFGQRAITATDGNSVVRLDSKIPNDIFEVNNLTEGKERVQSVRDYVKELIYWSFPRDIEKGAVTYPNKMLVFNYANGAYSYFDDNYTALGLFQKASGYRWSTIGKKWSKIGIKWSDALSVAETPIVIGGNQRGFIHQLNFLTIDDPSLDVSVVNTATGVITCTNHNLPDETTQYIRISNLLDISGYDETIIYEAIVKDADTLQVNGVTFVGTYIGGGSISLMKFSSFKTKDFNPFIEKGANIRIGSIDIYTDRTDGGELGIQIFGSDMSSLADVITKVSTAYEGFNKPDNARAWKRIIVNTSGVNLQIEAQVTGERVLEVQEAQRAAGETITAGADMIKAKITLHAMRLWLKESGKNIGLL